MIHSSNLSSKPTVTNPSGSSSAGALSAADQLSASFPKDASALQHLIDQGKDLMAGLDPNSFKGFKIIKDGNGKEWVVS